MKPTHVSDADVEALIADHHRVVHRLCLAKLSRREDAEDATQETFIRFLQADLHGIDNTQAWLLTVASRVCCAILRRRYKYPEADLDSSPPQVVRNDHAEQVLDAAWFLRVVNRLPENERKVLTWLYVGRLSRQEMAERLGVSPGHLRVIAFRARRRAQSVMATLDDGLGL